MDNNNTTIIDVLIIGGGAAGFFAAINCAEANPNLNIQVLERGKSVLQKVKISGGGRCNVTHACFDPGELVKFYPRGAKALRGPFTRFCTGDTMEWYESRGVALKIEADNRVFPVSNESQSIVSCLLQSCTTNNIQIHTQQNVRTIIPPSVEKNYWTVNTPNNSYTAKKLMMATGSSPQVWYMLGKMGLKIVAPVPSLFTFKIKDERIKDLPGLSVPNAHIKIIGEKLEASGPLLITHWGLSGPGILKLSSWGAARLSELKYQFSISVNWLGNENFESVRDMLNNTKSTQAKKSIISNALFGLPNRLWKKLTEAAGVTDKLRWAEINKKTMNALANQITACELKLSGKSTFKEEFVTAGGVDLKEIDFKTFSSKQFPSLYFAGEVLNIDAVTGGFNFQAAWTGGWIAGKAMGGG